jgi:cytochrome c oxidase assembly factor CtaG
MASFALPLAVRPRRLARASIAACAAAQCAAAQAHEMVVTAGGKPVFDWQFPFWVTALLALSIGLYGIGFVRLYGRSGEGRPARRWQAAAFVAGWAVLALALLSPLGALSDALFSAHMVEHEAMMLVCAPLLVLGRPLGVMLWGFPHAMRLAVGRAVRSRPVAASWQRLTAPLPAWALHALALWAWHVPALFQAAVAHPAIHTMQHASFLVTALLLWRGIVGEGATRRGSGHAMLSLFTTMVHTGALGALIALAPGVWYPSYIEPTSLLGIDPLQDQQLGGLIMWVPGAVAYLIGALAVASRWLTRGPRTSRRHDWPALAAQPRLTSGKRSQ